MKYIVLILLLVGCNSTTTQTLDLENKFYKRDVRILFEGREYLGAAVLPQRTKYNLEMTFIGQLDLFTFRSCHREVTQEDAGGGKIFGKKNKVSFTYEPIALESEHCPIEVGGFEKEKGRHSWGFIDFETAMETLPALVLCNGQRTQFNGVSICQGLHGLMMQAIFTDKTEVKWEKHCTEPRSLDGLKFDLMLGVGRCVYSFRSEKGDWHRLTTLGYQDIIIKNVE